MKDRKNHDAYNALHEERSSFVKTVVRFELHAACARVTAGENDGSIAALATIAVAFFTLTLWRATNRLWQAAEKDLAAFDRSMAQNREIADDQIATMGDHVSEAKRTADEMANVAIEMGKNAQAGFKAAGELAESARATWESAGATSKTAKAMSDAAEEIKKAATVAHQTYLATHRPHLVIHSARVLQFDDRIPPDQQALRVEFAIVNAGSGVCKMVTGSAVSLEYLYPIDRPHLPSLVSNNVIPQRRFAVGATDNSIVVTSDGLGGLHYIHAKGEAEFIAGFGRSSPGVDIGDHFPKKLLYLQGWVAYEEDSGNTRTTYFRRIYDHAAERFAISTDPDDEKTY